MIQKLLNDIILAEDKKKREEVTGKGITSWRSSGLGTCMRGRYLDRLLSGTGIKPEHDARTLRVFEMGNQVEDWLMNSLEKQDMYKLYQQIELEDPEYNLTGHLDGYLVQNVGVTREVPQEIIVECKSKNSRAFWYMDTKKEGAQVHHKMQLHTYLYMMNKYGGKLPDGTVIAPRSGLLKGGCVLYVSKDDMAMLEYPVRLDDKELEKMWKYELDTLNKCWKDKTAPPAPEKGSWQQKYCKFCEAGICETLDEAMAKGLWEDKEKELVPEPKHVARTMHDDPMKMMQVYYDQYSDGTVKIIERPYSEIMVEKPQPTTSTEAPLVSYTYEAPTPAKKKRAVAKKYKFKAGDRVMNVLAESGTIKERIGSVHYGVAWDDSSKGATVLHEDNLMKWVIPF